MVELLFGHPENIPNFLAVIYKTENKKSNVHSGLPYC